MTMLLSSCTKEYYTEGDSLSIKTIIGNVAQGAWGYSNTENNNYFYATISAPEITKDVLHNGVVKVYRVYNFNQSNETHTELPFLLHHVLMIYSLVCDIVLFQVRFELVHLI